MRRFRTVLFTIYGIFHFALLFFTIYVSYLRDSGKLLDLLEFTKYIPRAPWIALFGVLLFLLSLSIHLWLMNKQTRRINFLEQERKDYKAKLFDLTAIPDPPEDQDK